MFDFNRFRRRHRRPFQQLPSPFRQPFRQSFGFSGELQVPRLRDPGPYLQMPPYETIIGYRRDSPALSGPQLDKIKRVAAFIANSWSGPAGIFQVRVTGYIDPAESKPDLGQQRADTVAQALMTALHDAGADLSQRIQWTTEDRGAADFAKVEIYIWAGPTQMPVPKLVRIPSPAEAARKVVPQGEETPDQRIQRILRTQPPPPPAKKTLNEMFWKKANEKIDSVMNSANVPRSLRGSLRSGIQAAIRYGSARLLDEVLDAAQLPSSVRDALREKITGIGELKP
jgi:hypothetical protein